jgi:hypothetical protein
MVPPAGSNEGEAAVQAKMAEHGQNHRPKLAVRIDKRAPGSDASLRALDTAAKRGGAPMRAKKKGTDAQPLVQSPQYGWKSVQAARRQDVMVVGQQDVQILSIRQEGGVWWVGYLDPETHAKTEQLYHAQDSLYVRLKENEE